MLYIESVLILLTCVGSWQIIHTLAHIQGHQLSFLSVTAKAASPTEMTHAAATDDGPTLPPTVSTKLPAQDEKGSADNSNVEDYAEIRNLSFPPQMEGLEVASADTQYPHSPGMLMLVSDESTQYQTMADEDPAVGNAGESHKASPRLDNLNSAMDKTKEGSCPELDARLASQAEDGRGLDSEEPVVIEQSAGMQGEIESPGILQSHADSTLDRDPTDDAAASADRSADFFDETKRPPVAAGDGPLIQADSRGLRAEHGVKDARAPAAAPLKLACPGHARDWPFTPARTDVSGWNASSCSFGSLGSFGSLNRSPIGRSEHWFPSHTSGPSLQAALSTATVAAVWRGRAGVGAGGRESTLVDRSRGSKEAARLQPPAPLAAARATAGRACRSDRRVLPMTHIVPVRWQPPVKPVVLTPEVRCSTDSRIFHIYPIDHAVWP